MAKTKRKTTVSDVIRQVHAESDGKLVGQALADEVNRRLPALGITKSCAASFAYTVINQDERKQDNAAYGDKELAQKVQAAAALLRMCGSVADATAMLEAVAKLPR